jgi:hypothetical protein
VFTDSLSQEEKNDFRFSTLEELHHTISALQQRSESEKKMLSIRRLRPFLEGMEQYSKVVETFMNGSEILGVIWVYLSGQLFENIILHSLTYQ